MTIDKNDSAYWFPKLEACLSHSPAEAPIVANAPTVQAWYEVEFSYSFYGEEKSRVWTFRTETEAIAQIRETARGLGDRWRQYLFFRRHEATALPLPEGR
jgi:hypothetical protein